MMCGTAAAASLRSTVMRTISEPARASAATWPTVAVDIGGIGVRHRLDHHRRAAADGHVADLDRHRLVPRQRGGDVHRKLLKGSAKYIGQQSRRNNCFAETARVPDGTGERLLLRKRCRRWKAGPWKTSLYRAVPRWAADARPPLPRRIPSCPGSRTL